jgi:hypothetical protein
MSGLDHMPGVSNGSPRVAGFGQVGKRTLAPIKPLQVWHRDYAFKVVGNGREARLQPGLGEPDPAHPAQALRALPANTFSIRPAHAVAPLVRGLEPRQGSPMRECELRGAPRHGLRS